MNVTLKKITACILIVALIVPATLFSRPQKADAFIDCLIGELMGSVTSSVASGAASALAVPVHDMAHTLVSGQNLAQNTSRTTKECILDFLVNTLANTMIQQFTNSIVQWINSGFHGSPSFITNPEGFFMEIGDIAVGSAIEDLGLIGEILCNGFDLDLRLALGLQYSTSHKEYVGCRLSDVQKNIMNSFTQGNFGGDAGWDTWFAIHSEPTNNPYGTYFKLTAEADNRILKFKNRKLQELTEGRGFLSMKKCPSPSGTEAAYREDLEGKCQTVTPGSVIENQLNSHLGSPTRKLELADEINEIVGALVNQALVQVMGATGLSGGSSRSYGGGRSFTFSTQNTQQAFEQEVRIQRATSMPANISENNPDFDGDDRPDEDGDGKNDDYDGCEAFSRNTYEIIPQTTENTNTTIYRVWVQKPTYIWDGDKKVWIFTGFTPPSQAIKDTGEFGEKGTPWDDVDLRTIDAYCRNIAEQQQVDSFNPIPDWDFSTGDSDLPVNVPNYNIALNRPTQQSSTANAALASRAVDGTPIRYSHTGGEAFPWWEVTLDKRSYIQKLKIFMHDGAYDYHYVGNLKIEIFDTSISGARTLVKTFTVSQPGYPTPIPWEIPIDTFGRVVKLTRTDSYFEDNKYNNYLILGEVEVIGRDADVRSTGTTENSEIPLQITLEPRSQNIAIKEGEQNLSGRTPTGKSILTTNRALTNVTLAITLRDNRGIQNFGYPFDQISMTIIDTSNNSTVLSGVPLPLGSSSYNLTIPNLKADGVYEIVPNIKVKDNTVVTTYQLLYELKNSAGVLLDDVTGRSVINIEIQSKQ